jgi:hypothetical protein
MQNISLLKKFPFYRKFVKMSDSDLGGGVVEKKTSAMTSK